MYRDYCSEDVNVYKTCRGCTHHISGTRHGVAYETCNIGIGNPETCLINSRRKLARVTKCINTEKERKNTMRKELYKKPLKKMVSVRLRELRKEKGLTQSSLERALKGRILQSAISCYERGKTLPSVKVIGILAKFFKVSPSYIYGYSDKRKFTLIDRIKGLFGQSYAL